MSFESPASHQDDFHLPINFNGISISRRVSPNFFNTFVLYPRSNITAAFRADHQ